MTALRFDIDSEGGGAAWIEAELPAPNLIVVNPANGHAHLTYLLGAWVRTDFGDPSRLRVVRHAAAIERAYASALGADQAYAGRFQHNPFSDAYVTKIGRQAPYSLAELAQYVDLYAPAAKAAPPQGFGRNVEIFDRLRRWAYSAVADWKFGTPEAWERVVSERATQIAAEVGAESPRGPLPANEVGHIIKSVARWVWERYSAGTPPLLREAQLVARRERERARQAAREASRQRSEQTRAEYLAPAQKRRAQAERLRGDGLSLRLIARALGCSVAEVHRLLQSVQGSPAQSDFTGACVSRVERGRRRSRSVLVPVLTAPPPASTEEGVEDSPGVPLSLPQQTLRSVQSSVDVQGVAGTKRRGQAIPELSPAAGDGRRAAVSYEGTLAAIQRRIREIVDGLGSAGHHDTPEDGSVPDGWRGPA